MSDNKTPNDQEQANPQYYAAVVFAGEGSAICQPDYHCTPEQLMLAGQHLFQLGVFLMNNAWASQIRKQIQEKAEMGQIMRELGAKPLQ